MSPILQIRLLGDFSLRYGDELVAGINTPRLQSLFAYLVLHRGTAQLRQHLAFLFWPDSSEAQARNNLRQLLHELRHALPAADRLLLVDSRTVGWRPDAPFQLDVAEFERALEAADGAEGEGDQLSALERAARLYRSDLLPTCYDEWIVAERERLRQLQRRGVVRLLELLEGRREYAEAIAHAQRLLHSDPFDEEVCRRLMRLLALNQDRAGALRVYHSYAATLQRELGVEPSQPTRKLFERLLRADSSPAPAMERTPMGDAGLPLVGRQDEWQQLQEAWSFASAGEPGFVLITGEAGIGKSRLAEELLRWAHLEGVSVAMARTYAAEGQLSLAPVTDWLRSEAVRPQLGRLDPVWLAEVSRILPELLAARPDLPPHVPITEYGQRQRFFEALARAVLAAPPPLMLLIDDLQWCDQETIEWLHFLLRFDPRSRVLVVGTARDEEVAPQHPLRALLRHLRSTIRVTELALQPLDAAETARLAAHIEDRELDSDSALQLYRETEGSPLFVVEMVRAQVWGPQSQSAGAAPRRVPSEKFGAQQARLPSKVQAAIESRLAQLSPPARALAGLAAAIGRAFTLDLLVEAGQTDEDSAVGALDELWQKRIVREQGPNRYDFTHDKLREVAYAAIGAPQRHLLHRRIARRLEALHRDDLDPISGQIAAHYERAGMAEQAIPYYRRAAGVAQRLYANEDAISLLLRALALLEQLAPGATRDRQELTLQLALAPLYRMTKGWTSPEVEAVITRAMALCETVGDDQQRAQVFYGLQSLYVVQARLERVQLISDELHRLYQRTQSAAPPLVTELMLIGSRLHLGRITEANIEFERMLAECDPTQLQRITEEQGWNYAVHGRAWHAHALWLLGYPEAALRRGLDALGLAHELAQPFNQVVAMAYLALLQQWCADEAAAKARAEEALAFTIENRAPYYRAWAAILVSYALAREQPGADTIAGLREAIAAFRASGARLRLPYYLGLLGCACLRAGRVAEGLAALEEGMAAAREHNERWWDAELHRLRGELLLRSGADAQEAEVAYLRSLDIARAQRARSLELRAAMSLARLWSTPSRADDARRLLDDVYAGFTEGFDTPDLQAARSLLATL